MNQNTMVNANNQSKSSMMSDLVNYNYHFSNKNDEKKIDSMFLFQENQFNLLGIENEFEKDDQPALSLAKLKSVPTASNKLQFMVVSEDSIAFTSANNILAYLHRKTARKIEGLEITIELLIMFITKLY